MFENEMALLGFFVFGFGVPYLVVVLVLGTRISSENAVLLELTHYLGKVGNQKRVLKRRPYLSKGEKLNEDEKGLPKRLTKPLNDKVQLQLPIVKKAKKKLLLFMLGVYLVHQISSCLIFSNDPIMWLIAPGYFAIFYLIYLFLLTRNRVTTLAKMEGYRSRRF